MFQDVKISNAINQGQLRFGMTKQEVARVIGSPMVFDVKTYTDEKGTKEDWSYEWGPNLSATYILHFENGVLKSWETR